jgi:hypothetical protein
MRFKRKHGVMAKQQLENYGKPLKLSTPQLKNMLLKSN